MKISSAAGKPADPSILVNVPKLITAYYELRPDPSDPRQRVVFGTSGHRGSAVGVAFNEWHILAITQAICDYRKQQNINGPLFLGMDTHALSEPALASALEVLAANHVDVMLSGGTAYTPTPAISHAILRYNRGKESGLAGGIRVIAKDGWFAARPSGTKEIYKIYAESFLGRDHLRQIEEEAQTMVSEALARSIRAA